MKQVKYANLEARTKTSGMRTIRTYVLNACIEVCTLFTLQEERNEGRKNKRLFMFLSCMRWKPTDVPKELFLEMFRVLYKKGCFSCLT